MSDIEVGAPTEQVSKNITTAGEPGSTEVKEDAAVEEPLVQPVADRPEQSEPVAVALAVANSPEPDIVRRLRWRQQRRFRLQWRKIPQWRSSIRIVM